MKRIIGIDHQTLGELFHKAMFAVMRRDPDQVVICTSHFDDSVSKVIQVAFETGHEVLLVRSREKAPEKTEWLDTIYSHNLDEISNIKGKE